MIYTALAEATASGKDSYGNVVTSTASATATSDISQEDAFTKAEEIAQNVANSQLQTDINIIDQSVETSVNVIGKGHTGNTGPIGNAGPTGEKGENGGAANTGSTGPTGPLGSFGELYMKIYYQPKIVILILVLSLIRLVIFFQKTHML